MIFPSMKITFENYSTLFCVRDEINCSVQSIKTNDEKRQEKLDNCVNNTEIRVKMDLSKIGTKLKHWPHNSMARGTIRNYSLITNQRIINSRTNNKWNRRGKQHNKSLMRILIRRVNSVENWIQIFFNELLFRFEKWDFDSFVQRDSQTYFGKQCHHVSETTLPG